MNIVHIRKNYCESKKLKYNRKKSKQNEKVYVWMCIWLLQCEKIISCQNCRQLHQYSVSLSNFWWCLL